jgi:predicted transcriptional regulator
VPPAPLFERHTTHGRVPTVQRAAIVVLRKQGRTRTEIGQQAGVSQPTVRRVLARYEETKEVSDAPRTGGPRKTNFDMDVDIALASLEEPFLTPRQIKRKFDLEDVSISTIKRRLVEADLHGRVARHVFQLTDEHKRKRLSFAEGYQRWTKDDWCRVAFADVKTFLGEGRSGQRFVRRPVGEAMNPRYSVAHKPHPVGVPAWGCFTAHGPGYMAMFEGSLEAAGLRDIFRDYLLPTVKEHFGEGADWWLLHDNDPGRHHSRVLRTWMHNNYVRPLDFPPYSPDLNPIENLWADMDKRMQDKLADTKEEMEEVVQQVWAETTVKQCRKLTRSMPHRIKQVIERRGAYTDY